MVVIGSWWQLAMPAAASQPMQPFKPPFQGWLQLGMPLLPARESAQAIAAPGLASAASTVFVAAGIRVWHGLLIQLAGAVLSKQEF